MQNEKLPPLEEGLLTAMRALDNQISKEVQRRTPGEREEHGVQKWDPYLTRIERVSAFLLSQFGDDELRLDSFIVLAQSLTKSLQLIVDELGEEGLGNIRTVYAKDTFQRIIDDATRGLNSLKGENAVM